MQVNGKIKLISDEKIVGNDFRKKEIVVTTQEQYPQEILIEFVQDKIELLNDLKPGDDVTIHINLRGRMWTNPEGVEKYFNSLHGWKVEKTQSQMATEQSNDDLF